MDGIDPATKQYIIFSLVISIIIGVIINFVLIESVKGSFAYGFPINLNEVDGVLNFIYRVIDSLVIGGFLTFPVYFGIKYLQRGGGSF